MLMIFETFMMRYGIRSAQYLPNPNIGMVANLHLPRNVVIHYLDQTIDNMFPNRNLYYFKEVDDSKRIRIMNLTDLRRKEGTINLKNRYLAEDIRDWVSKHRGSFRVQDLILEPQDDEHNTGVVNYNTVKDLYNYRSSLLAEYDKTYNLLETFAKTLKSFIEKDSKNYQLMTLDIPNNIPGYVYMNKLMTFNNRKLMDVVDENNFFWMFEIYKWLGLQTRKDSVFKEISDQDSKRILLEIRFRGYSTYVLLSTIRALSEESPLESTKKFNEQKLLKFFLSFLIRLQDQITSLNLADIEKINNLDDDEDKEVIEDEDDEVGEIKEKEITSTIKEEVSKFDPEVEIKDVFDKDEEDSLDELFKEVDKYDKLGLDRLTEEPKKKLITPKKTDVDPDVEEIDDLPEEEEVEEEAMTGELMEPEPLTPDEEEELLGTEPPDSKIDKFVKRGEVIGTISSSEIKALRTAQEKRKRLKDPYSKNPVDSVITTPEDDIALEEDVIKIDVKDVPVADNMLTDVTSKFDSEYVTKTMKKDVVSTVMAMENNGAVITNYETEVIKSSVDNYELHKFEIRPLNGKVSTLYFRLPIVDKEGSFMVSGREYRMRKVKQDLPIRKISPVRVALTSNYGKIFVSRTERKAYDTDQYIIDYIRKAYLEGTGEIVKIVPGKKRMNLIKGLPNQYFKLASNFDKLETKKYTFLFLKDDIESVVSEKDLNEIRKEGRVFLGYTNKDKHIVSMDIDGNLINQTKKEPIGPLIDELDIDRAKLPKSFSSITVVGKEIPFGVVMGYYMGISSLIRVTKTKYRLIPSNKRITELGRDEVEIRFGDFRLILDLDTEEKRLIFHGFLYYRDFIKMYKLKSFDKSDIYLNLIEFRGAALYNLKELDNLNNLFIDPITKAVLEEIKEPSDFKRLLFRANELLKDYSYPDINDPEFSRIRGYDRVPGLLYRALAETMREHNLSGRASSKLSLDPYKVWNYITQDSSIQARESLNPVAFIKEDEIVTLTGRDGLSTVAVPKEMRRYHKNDTGLFSEGTSDSKNVAITASLSPYAKIKNVRGLVRQGTEEVDENQGKIFSSALQMSPFGEYDDPKRMNFINIQVSHTVASKGYRQPPLRTGYEYILPYKTSENYCKMAEDDGVVVSKTKDLMVVKYKDGSEITYRIGSFYTNYEGIDYKNNLATTLKEGDKFKKGDALYYHEDFFEPDWLNKNKIVGKLTRFYTVALVSNSETYEDSTAISTRVMKDITTSILKERSFVLDFSTNINNMVKVGDEVYPNDPLFVDTGDGYNAGNLNETSLSLLEAIASMSPRAKYRGVIDRIEVKYNGDVSDMSPTLAAIVNKLDKETYQRTKGTKYEAKNNRVTGEYSVGGKKLDIDNIELKFYINVELEMAVGDKLAMGNQAKSVIGEVYEHSIEGAESHDVVDGMIATVSFIYRAINSPVLMGTTARIVRHVSKQVSDVYFGSK